MFRTRGGALLAGIIAAFLAAILLIVYLKSYRSSVNSGKQPITVLVAKRLIPKGTSAKTIATLGLYQVTTVRKDHLEPLAIANPGTLTGQIAAHDINPGAQLTSSDFTGVDASELQYQIVGKQRAISVPIDTAHGLIGPLVSGDKVDVYVGTNAADAPIVKLLASNILVLVAPGGNTDSGSNASTAVLRVNSNQAALFAYAADNARLWFVLRPQVGATPTKPSIASQPSLLKRTR